ncbi:MAG: hypothetical protein ACP5T1_07005 [Thermoplasmata archaeon]
MKNLEDIKDIPEISVSLEKQIIDILSGHKGNAFTISGIISELTGEFRIEMFSGIQYMNTLTGFDKFSNLFEFYALVFHILEDLARNDPKIKAKIIVKNHIPITFYWYQDQ